MRYSEKWGDSIDNAVELALADLKLTREQVNVTVLEEPSKGFFGIGSRLAKVRVEEKGEERPVRAEKTVTHEDGNEVVIEVCGVNEDPAERPARPERPERPRENRGRRAGRGGRGRASENRSTEYKASAADSFVFGEAKIFGERPDDLVEVHDHPAEEFLNKLSREMGLDVSIRVSANEGSVFADIEGPDSGTIIGKRGQTLDAVQYLTSLVVNKGEEGYVKVVVDAEGYRQKREIALEKLAVRLADKARKGGRSVRLEPMNPYERKVIHTALQKVDGVSTRSEGEEPYRRVIIEPNR